MTDFNAQLIGRTEKALNAILERELAGVGINSSQWVALTLTVTGGGASVVSRLSEALRVSPAVAQSRLAELASLGLVRPALGGGFEATEEGAARWGTVRAAVGPVTQSLWGDLPAGELAVAGRVLETVLTRANAVLSMA
ncbi:hypothetical protein DFJ67_6633 [Asanoa ferruginea]|uniref:DNA-binding MarR family transcriptional regulator n=1 Tax=Asanoa ferruginea TaxID=53367 RepID=A0A3D9ZT67_9ACTN|nr:hypothetical protein [Asanoa ferruginea]REG00579.1 hypothetical protein DFJ67_6633 [Asanoa ferruginea]GIF47743.1 hypothetical protein Afe04nite_22820 [Asanoa ferruginea]